jgi:class 3 adenylate cyclase/PAS domain-containing protein
MPEGKQNSTEVNEAELLEQIDRLRCQTERLQRANSDLQIRLLTTTEHGDIVESELDRANQQLRIEVKKRQLAQATLQSILEIAIRDKKDLEIMLQTTAEHGDLVEYELYEQAIKSVRQRENDLIEAEANLWERVEQRTEELRKLTEVLQRNNSLLQAQQEAAIDGILSIDEQGHIISYNQHFCQMWNIDEMMFLSNENCKLLSFLITNQKLPLQLVEVIESSFDDPDQHLRSEIHFNFSSDDRVDDGADGSRVLECYATPVRSPQGKFYGIIWYFHDISDRIEAQLALQAEKERSEKLLLNILPEPIAERLKQPRNGTSTRGGTSTFIADSFADVTVMFADIVGFTAFSNHISPTELVGVLNRIFSIFDRLAEKHGLEKIKTIGDGYMVVGGLPTPRLDHVEAIAEMALDMRQEIKQFRLREEQPVALRIGINTGPVVAGVIGTKKTSYDLWGDTVNVASRMESQGLANMIQVTAFTYERIKHKYMFEQRGAIEIKGKGEMITYWLESRMI